MSRIRIIVLVVVVVVAVAAARLVAAIRRNHIGGREVPGGILISDAGIYDRVSRMVMGGFFRGIAADVAANAPRQGRVLEVGCGPGQLAIELARSHELDVTALDLDPAMIDRARTNAARAGADGGSAPTFVVGDVAALPFDDAAFDLVVSTLSMHHWSDRAAALRDIARVLRPGGAALIWDLRPGILPFHPEAPAAGDGNSGSPLGVPVVTPWRWPAGLTLTQRFAFRRD